MQIEKIKKPSLSSTIKKQEYSHEQMVGNMESFYRYRLPSIYRELKQPIYDSLGSSITKPQTNTRTQLNKSVPKNSQSSIEISTQILHKKVTLNSKYHHRQKMRFSRTPLLKFLKYDFRALEQKLKSKNYMKIYDDLQEQGSQDDQPKEEDKKQYEKDPHFSPQALARYKKKNGINSYIVSAQGYQDIKERLINEYGWVENPDVTSLMYDYKHMSKKKNIDYVNLLQDQVVNHFHENKSITAKFGLTRNIRNICSLGKDPAQFFPRCFDVNDVSQLQNFYQSFKETYCQSIVKKYVNNKGFLYPKCQKEKYEKIVGKAVELVERQFLSVEKKVALIIENKKQIYITQEEWQVLLQHENIGSFKGQIQEEHCNEELFKRASRICEVAEKSDPQWKINKDNIWIVKPASLSRGRGIKTFNQINQMFDYIIGKQISWVVQKYIENPLIIKKRKFDIRQWVLLTDFKPFRVWIYDECYIRFCATTYEPENLKDRKIHLTNNSVTKGVSDITNDGIKENMMFEKDFSDLLREKEGKDVFKQMIKPQMKKIAVQALESVKQNMLSRKNTFQIFGFDFMIDQDYRVWLIEVNSSPTMQYSTKVTTDIVQRGMSDLADLVNNYMFKGKYYDKSKAQKLYGGWKLLTNQ